MTTSKNYVGTCTMCGEENRNLTIVDEVAHVCSECLDNEYFYCDECHEYWLCDVVEYYELDDGRTVCEYCYEDIEEEE